MSESNKSGAISYVAAILLLPFVFIICFGPSRKDKILQNGREGVATVVRLEDTGNRFNDMPQIRVFLDVDRDGQEPYRVRLRMVMDAVELVQYQPGARVAIRIDRDDPTLVAIAGLYQEPDPAEASGTPPPEPGSASPAEAGSGGP